ncbi:MAG: tyrosine-type recombinase/integrase [Sphaerochaeta sp.]|jgi:integrase|nr:tyrosine-type recombinase/integrase [Sphaerochaeta sp.]
MKNPNGYGTVYRLQGDRRKPYIVRVPVGKKNGRTVYRTLDYFEEKTAAVIALAEYNKNPVATNANITLKELYDEWSKIKYAEISRQTEDNYKAGWKYLSEYGNVKVKDVRSGHIRSVINSCGKSRSTMEKIKIVAGMLFDYALENDIVHKNYAKFVKLPKTEKTKHNSFTDIEIKKIEDNADKIEWVDTILILIYTGLRISELLSLTRFNIDLKAMTITGGIKTDAGKDRIIPIHPKILKYIKIWYDKNGDTLIFHKDKEPIRARYYRDKYYMPTLQSLGIRELSPHKCRHTCARLMAEAGMDKLAIQRILGHESYSTTADIYTQTDIDFLQKEMAKM